MTSPLKQTPTDNYIRGEFKISMLSPSTFQLTGNWKTRNSDLGVDHLQLLYEALEIASQSGDQYAEDFAAFRDELLSQTEDWLD